ncbi:hypothetical protein TSOC_008853 [Tetrabaena socialis]|uniref:phytol kinase n=1 Tax=Tetrabaena socialis TaxID=47790 RepID=A0A2J7ZXD5_9CHLO|nr:hypothetical protein TSOC_008853 [Tetrabaena socialis]|eukprot:PNH04941.1 hypothetical protein TSOC_008853 [Tetrabaena socialis]
MGRSLARLSALGLELSSPGPDPSLAALRSANDDIDVLIESSGYQEVWPAVGKVEMLTLHAVVLRRSSASLTPELSEEHRAAHAALRTKLTEALIAHLRLDSSAAQVATANAVIRSHSLRCYARLLADSSAQLSQRRSRRAVQAALGLLAEARRLLTALHRLDHRTAVPGAPRVVRGLSDEVPASGLLEHWARALLLVALPGEGGEDEAAAELAGMAPTLVTMDFRTYHVTDTPSLSYLLSSHVVRLCSAMDGGPDHGLGQGDVRYAAPLFDTTQLRLRPGSRAYAGTTLAQAALRFWHNFILHTNPTAPKTDLFAGPFTCERYMQQSQVLRVTTQRGDWRAQRAMRACSAQCAVGLTGAASQVGLHAPSTLGGAAVAGTAAAAAPAATPLSSPPAAAAAAPPPDGPCATRAAGEPRAQLAPAETELDEARRCRDMVWACSIPPLNMQAAFELAMRLVACALGALAEPATARAGMPLPVAGDGAGAAGPVRPRVARLEAMKLAVLALLCARKAARQVVAAAVLQRRDLQRLEGYWAAVMTVVNRQQANETQELFKQLHLTPQSHEGPPRGLPPAPSPDVAAALAAGWAPGMERLLRLPGPLREDVDFPDEDYHDSFQGGAFKNYGSAWGQLLAFGPPCAVAAAVATAAKCIQRGAPTARAGTAPAIRLLFWASPLPVCWLAERVGAQPLAAATRDGLAAAGSAAGAGGGGGGGDGPGGLPVAGSGDGGASQLRLLLSWVALRISGPLSRAAQAAASLQPSGLPAEEYSKVKRWLPSLLWRLLRWVTVLAAAHAAAAAAAHAGGAEPGDAAAAAAAAAGAAAAEWRDLLLREVGLSAVLGLGLTCAPPRETHPAPLYASALHGALLALARLMPAELAAVVRAADAVVVEGPEAAADKAGIVRGQLLPTLQLLRHVLGPGGGLCEPRVLAAVERVCGEGGGHVDSGEEGLGVVAGAAEGEEEGALPPHLAELLAGGAMLAAPAEARALLPVCANPLCGNLEGPSEAALKLLRCGGCGGRVRYCSRGCQQAHWRAGHAAECGALQALEE